MAVFNFILICFMIYYTYFFFRLSFKKKRDEVKTQNIQLDKLRKVPIKTLQQQKQFINTKYPKSTKFKFTWIWLGKIVLMIAISILLYKAYSTIFLILKINVKLWMIILIVILFPLLVNLLLRIFHLEKDDLTIFFR